MTQSSTFSPRGSGVPFPERLMAIEIPYDKGISEGGKIGGGKGVGSAVC